METSTYKHNVENLISEYWKLRRRAYTKMFGHKIWPSLISDSICYICITFDICKQGDLHIATSVFLSMFFLEGAFWLIFYINPEMFPPLFVPFSFSISGVVGRVVTIAAPQIAEIKPKQVPIIIFLIICGLSTISTLFLRKPKL